MTDDVLLNKAGIIERCLRRIDDFTAFSRTMIQSE